ncbi:MAG: hypothetical protein Q4G30_01165 [Actinomycetaceae bacterium]|nr:hypothetical protein [Actinomycetaceae bacterium]
MSSQTSSSSPRTRLPALIYTTRDSTVDHLSVPDGVQRIRIDRGVHIELEADLGYFEFHKQIALARMAAALHQCGAGAYLVGHSAALARGCDIKEHNPDVEMVGAKAARRSPRWLPVCQYYSAKDKREFVAHPVKILKRRARCLHEPVEVISGLPVTSIPDTILDVAQYSKPLAALVAADSLIRRHCKASRFERATSLDAQQEIKARLMRLLHQRAGYPGTVQAKAVIEWMSCLSESVGESVVRWALLVYGLRDMELQTRIDTRKGTYYPDIFFRRSGIGIEYDGVGKYDDGQTLHNQSVRQYALQRQGVEMARISGTSLQALIVFLQDVHSLVASRQGVVKLEPVHALGRLNRFYME